VARITTSTDTFDTADFIHWFNQLMQQFKAGSISKVPDFIRLYHRNFMHRTVQRKATISYKKHFSFFVFEHEHNAEQRLSAEEHTQLMELLQQLRDNQNARCSTYESPLLDVAVPIA
jgi:S-methylmethionine-dependent homocysteine/selenocysteine methylase